MYTVKKQSKWKFDNSANTSLGIGYVSGALGTLTLKDPEDFEVDFSYKSLGGGVSWGLNLNGKEGKDAIDSDLIGIGTPADWASGGDIWISSSFEKDELTAEDFTGFCIVVELSLGLPVASLSAMEMWFGIPASLGPKELSLLIIQSQTSVVMARMLSKKIKLLRTAAKGRLRIGSVPIGLSLSIGATLSIGWLGKGEYKQAPIIKMPTHEENPNPPIRQTQKDTTVITIPGDILFDWDEYKLKEAKNGKPSAAVELQKLLPKIRSYSNRNIKIIGHTDNTEKTPGHNQTLSENRARSVWGYFAGTGMNTSKMTTEGRGATEPVANNNTEDGRKKNRRVEIHIMPN